MVALGSLQAPTAAAQRLGLAVPTPQEVPEPVEMVFEAEALFPEPAPAEEDWPCYIATFQDTTPHGYIALFCAKLKDLGGSCPSVYRNILQGRGVSFCLPQDVEQIAEDVEKHTEQLGELMEDINEYVLDMEGRIKLTGDTTAAFDSWGLDRINQRHLPLDGQQQTCMPHQQTQCSFDGSGTVVFVIDSGVHGFMEDFGGRVHYQGTKSDGIFDFVDWDSDASDCNGHGTHVAASINSDTYGVARGAIVKSIRVLDCNGKGYSDSLLNAMDLVATYYEEKAKPAGQRVVVNISLGGPKSFILNNAARDLYSLGVLVVASSGNSYKDACFTSPASESTAITVGATNSGDSRASFSNFGACVSLYAPGQSIPGLSVDGAHLVSFKTGTSQAAPLAAGVVALLLQRDPTATAASIKKQLLDLSTKDIVKSIVTGPNRLLFDQVPPYAVPHTPILSEELLPSFPPPVAGKALLSPTCNQYTASPAPGGVPIVGKKGAFLDIKVADDFRLASIAVRQLSISHGRIGDLRIRLRARSPGKKWRTVLLVPRKLGPDGDGQNMHNVTLADSAALPWPQSYSLEAPFANKMYRPAKPLQNLVDLPASGGVVEEHYAGLGGSQGTWRLTVFDSNAESQGGTLDQWSMTLCEKLL